MALEGPVYKLDEMPTDQHFFQGHMNRRAIRLEGALLLFNTFVPDPNGEEPLLHRHPYDMLLVVQSGTMMFEVDGKVHRMEAGTAARVPAMVYHRGYAVGDEPAQLLELFAPVRKDYLHLTEYQGNVFKDMTGQNWFVDESESNQFQNWTHTTKD